MEDGIFENEQGRSLSTLSTLPGTTDSCAHLEQWILHYSVYTGMLGMVKE